VQNTVSQSFNSIYVDTLTYYGRDQKSNKFLQEVFS